MSVLKSFFTFGGVSSKDLSLTIEEKDILNCAEADVNGYEIPGRDGVVFESNRRYRNVEITYETYLKVSEKEDLARFTGDIKRWLLSRPGAYRRLEDTYDPDHYRMAAVVGPLEIEESGERFTRQSITFTCKPFRYRKAGEMKIIIGNGITLQNDTGFDALPLFEITMKNSGTVTISVESESGARYEETITAKSASRITVDSEIGEAEQSRTEAVLFFTLDNFPRLLPGKNTITVTGANVASAQITPRWREL